MDYDNLFKEDFSYQLQQKDTEPLKKYLIQKQGWVYIAVSENNNLLKIGRTGKNPLERAKSLSTVGVFHDYDILFSLPVFNQFIVEAKVHQRLKKYRVSKEFFSVKEAIAIDALQKEYDIEIQLLKRFLNTDMVREDVQLVPYALNKV